MARSRGNYGKSNNVDQVESASLAKHSYQLRTPIHSSETTAIASKNVRTRQDSNSADGSDKALDHSM